LTQLYYDTLAESAGGNLPDYLSVDQFLDHWLKVEQAALAYVVGRRQKVEDLKALLSGIQALYEDEKALRSMLEALDKEAQAYVKAVKSKDKSGEEDMEE